MKDSTANALPVSPFTDAYWKKEIKFLGLPKKRQTCGKVSIEWADCPTRCDDFFNINFRCGGPKAPVLLVNNRLWMSLTAMEVQSSALAINRAHGVTVTAGLGLGYFALRAAAKPEVQRVVVYEIEPDVIKWFRATYAGRPELEKIEIVEGDVTKLFVGKTADFVFMDIYEGMLEDDTLEHFSHFVKSNTIGRYHFWAQERVILTALLNRHIQSGVFCGSKTRVGHDFFTLVRHWQGHELDGHAAHALQHRPLEEEYTWKALSLMRRFNPM